ncbi:MAG: Crp/Fnr family transcriptional regulator [Dehalococcoidia bacterium]
MAVEGSFDDAGYAGNKVLRALPTDSRQRLLSVAQPVHLGSGDMVYWATEPIEHVLFPLDGVISIVSALHEGTISEVGTIGREGMVGVSVILGLDRAFMGAMSQVPGLSLRVPASSLTHELAQSGEARMVFNRYVSAFLTHISQTAACNMIHSANQRLAAWLLATHTRVRQDRFQLTHELLSVMLGVRRATVSELAANLQERGIIQYHRGVMTVTDRSALEEESCECLFTVIEEYNRMLPGDSPTL